MDITGVGEVIVGYPTLINIITAVATVVRWIYPFLE